MDIAELKRQAVAQRQFTVECDEAVFTVTAPTKLQSQVLYAKAAGDVGMTPASRLQFLREMLLAGISGWTGVRVSHILPDHGSNDPLPWEPAAVEVVLDACPEWEEKLSAALMSAIVSRRDAGDTAAKN